MALPVSSPVVSSPVVSSSEEVRQRPVVAFARVVDRSFFLPDDYLWLLENCREKAGIRIATDGSSVSRRCQALFRMTERLPQGHDVIVFVPGTISVVPNPMESDSCSNRSFVMYGTQYSVL